MSKKHNFTEEEVKQISDLSLELSKVIGQWSLSKLKPNGKDFLSSTGKKYNDALFLADVVLRGAGIAAGAFAGSVIERGLKQVKEAEEEITLSALRGAADGLGLAYDLFGISNVIDLAQYVKRKELEDE